MNNNIKEKKEISAPALESTLQDRLESQMRLLGQDLGKDERTIMDCFEKPRMILQRIYIIFNQSRKMVNQEIMKEDEMRAKLANLKKKEYITIEKFEYNGKENEAFILTDKGKELLN